MKCSVCGKEMERPAYGKDICSSECFHINFWNEKVEEHKVNPYLIIEGTVYRDAGIVENPRPYQFLGFGGRWFKILKDNGDIVETNNLWCSGDVPEDYLDKLPDNAKFTH